MYGRRLTSTNYRELIGQQSVVEIASYLKSKTFYSEALSDINENVVHRGQLENVLKKQLYLDYTRVFNYIYGYEHQFFGYVFINNEIEQILTCVRLLNSNKANEYIFSMPAFLAHHSSFDLYDLARVKNYNELIDNLQGTPYNAILKKHIPHDTNIVDFTALEVSLQSYYYSKIFAEIRMHFEGVDKLALRNLFSIEVDLANIVNIVRLKTNFNISNDYIRSNLLPFSKNINKSQQNQLVEAQTPEDVIAIAKHSQYSKAFQKNDFQLLEENINKYIFGVNESYLKISQSAPAVVSAYLHLKKIEINNLFSIIECVRYNVPSPDISKYLISEE